MIAINGMPDHVHMLARLKPAMAPAKIIQMVKKLSTDWINDRGFLDQHFNWQIGSAVFSVDYRKVDNVIRYIKNQKEHHAKKTFEKEYFQLLEAYNISYEDEYVFEFFN